MAKTDRRRPEERTEAMRTALAGLADGTDTRDLMLQLDALHTKGSLFPGLVLLDLAADALELSGASRAQPVDYDGIRERHLPEIDIRGKYQHRKSHYTLRAVAMIRAGVAPDLEAEVSWWSADDLHVWALCALLVYVRIAAEGTGQSIHAICQRLAANHGIELSAHT
jgi:hypothetical protein